MTIQDELLKVILPHFDAYQRQGQEEACELSLEASAKQLRTKISSLELASGLENLKLKEEETEEEPSEVEEAMGDLLVSFIDATVAAEATSDLQDVVDRVLSLIAAFGMTFSRHVGSAVLSRAIQFSAVLLERVRGHACILLGKITNALKKLRAEGKSDMEWIDESLVTIEEALLPRMQDKGQAVRCHAIKAAGNFFVSAEDAEEHGDILEAMLWNMAHDNSVNNRIAAVRSVPVNEATMDSLICRVRDIKDKVRVEALSVLGKKAQGVSDMSETQLVALIRSGLSNRCEVTKKAASKMICCGWMKSAKYDPIELLQNLNVLDNEDEANCAVDVIMNAARSEDSEFLEDLSDPELRAFRSGLEKAAVPIQSEDDDIKPEKLFYLRARCKNILADAELTSTQKEKLTGNLIPDVPLLCEVFGSHASLLMQAIDENDEETEYSESFICLQLLQLAEVSNLNEEGSRRHFAYVMKDMLSSIKTPDDLVEGCIQALRLTCINETEEMTDAIAAIIDNIHKTENLGDGETEEDEEMKTMKLVRILSVITVFLETASSQLSNNDAMTTFCKFVVPSVTHKDTLVREAAVGCFGKLGLFTDETTIVSEFKPILLEIASHEDETIEIRAQALLALSDWSLLHSECLAPCTVRGKEVSFTDIVRDMMDSPQISAVCIGSEIAAKLLFAGKVLDSEWFAKLVSIYFNPVMAEMEGEDEDIKEVGSPVRLQQLLGLFFMAICAKDDAGGRDALMGSILPLLDIVYVQSTTLKAKGRKTKKQVAWPVVRMVQFICQTIDDSVKPDTADDSTVVQGNGAEDHASANNNNSSGTANEPVELNSSFLASIQLAEFLANQCQVLTDKDTRDLCKLLGAADFDPTEEKATQVKALKAYMEELGMVIGDGASLKSLAELNEKLAEVEVDSDEESEGAATKEDGDNGDSEEEDNGGSKQPKYMVGTRFLKTFDGLGQFEGVITKFDGRHYHVSYPLDGDEENLSEDEFDDFDLLPADSEVAGVEGEVNLSNDLMKSLGALDLGDAITVDESFDKENRRKRGSKGKGRTSNGSTASRRSRGQLLSPTSAN